MRILFLFLLLSVMLVAASAEAQLCSPAWLANASGAEARSLIRAGADVNEICSANRNRPLHQALLNDRVEPDVIRAMLGAGADTSAENIHGENPVEYAQDRFDLARRRLRPGTAPYRREQSLYETVFGLFGDAGSASADAHAKLCDLNWWRNSASGDAVRELLAVPGADRNYVCNFNNDRIIHQPLKLASFTMLTENIMRGIHALVDADADLHVRNNSGQSALNLAEIRYDRASDRIIQLTIRWCNGGTDQQFADEVTRNKFDTGAYLYIASFATGQPYNQVSSRMHMELFRVHIGGTITQDVLCPYREIYNYR